MLRVEHLSLNVGRFALSDVSLQVEGGEYFVLMGATGSGKSMLARCICGLARVGSGRVVIDGTDVTEFEPRRRHVGYVPQDYALFPHLSVERNLTFGLEAHGAWRRTARREIAPLVEQLGIGHLLRRSTVNLSGGERQKVALGRALAARPKLLILDEPVSALDEPTRRELCPVLRDIQRSFNVATIHICHSLEEARQVADRVGIMADGRLVQAGKLDLLAAEPAADEVKRLLSKQEPS
jgi:ABC-type sugar transport system ATPase subunit